jgi:hypothetical protein
MCPFAHPWLAAVRVEAERPDRVRFTYQAEHFREDRSGQVEIRLRTRLAERVANYVQGSGLTGERDRPTGVVEPELGRLDGLHSVAFPPSASAASLPLSDGGFDGPDQTPAEVRVTFAPPAPHRLFRPAVRLSAPGRAASRSLFRLRDDRPRLSVRLVAPAVARWGGSIRGRPGCEMRCKAQSPHEAAGVTRPPIG